MNTLNDSETETFLSCSLSCNSSISGSHSLCKKIKVFFVHGSKVSYPLRRFCLNRSNGGIY